MTRTITAFVIALAAATTFLATPSQSHANGFSFSLSIGQPAAYPYTGSFFPGYGYGGYGAYRPGPVVVAPTCVHTVPVYPVYRPVAPVHVPVRVDPYYAPYRQTGVVVPVHSRPVATPYYGGGYRR